MVWFFAGLATLIAVLVAGRAIAQADPKKMAKALRGLAGVGALAVAVLLLLRGAVAIAIPLALFGAALLGMRTPFGGGFPFGGDARRSPGGQSEVRTSHIEMELDHDTGGMTGSVLAGRYAGKSLTTLSIAELLELRSDLMADDPQGARLLEAYLDRRDAEWRGRANPGQEHRADSQGGAMTAAEAYDILGLRAGATAEEIRRAHRVLMKKLHPDQGGSTWFAARLNQAKDVLLQR